MKETIWTSDAVGDFVKVQKVDVRAASRIHEAVVQFARSDAGDVKKLRGAREEWRLRVGDWRVVFVYEGSPPLMRVLRVANRRDAYG